MGRRISDKIRAAVVADLEQQGQKWAAIGRKHKISDETVKNIAKEAGLWLPSQAGREAMKTATEVRLAQAKEKRSVLMLQLLDDAGKLRQQLWQEAQVFKFGGKDNVYTEHMLPEPDFAGKRDIATALAVCIQQSLALERHDSKEGEEARGAIIALVESLTEQTSS